jgi:pimeloyl-ACP methyl ester carboxylesterase
MQSLSRSTQSAETLAEVRAHNQVMRYRRAGTGRPLVVLGGGPDALWPELEPDLATRYRVVTPEVPGHDGDAAAWARDFLEGVGLDRVVLLAAEPFCIAALELVLLDADRVERLVLVPSGDAGVTGLDGTLATTLEGAGVPLLVVRRGLPLAEALPLLRAFLGRDGRPRALG